MKVALRAAGLLVVILILMSCVSVGVTPELPFPKAPELTFTLVPDGTNVCLGIEEANVLRVYFDSLNAYQQALQRFHKKGAP